MFDYYQATIARLRAKWGDKLREPVRDAARFAGYMNTGQRIRVRFGGEDIRTGTVGMSTGWSPVFLLVLRSDSTGSPWVLDDAAEVVAVQRHGRYEPVGKGV